MRDKMKKFIPETLGGYPDNVWSRLIDPLRRLIKWDRAWRHVIDPLPSLVRKVRPEKIMEIGVHRGDSAGLLIRAAKKACKRKVEYYGFDLFETFSLEGIKEILEKTGTYIKLFKGDSRETLPMVIKSLPKMDLIFIDGGHSYEVVKPDWENVQKLMHKNTVVIFDDYGREKGVTKTVNEINRELYDVVPLIGRLPIPSSYIGRCVVKLR